MEGIRSVGMAICVTAAVTALFSMLVPEGKLDRVLKFAISLFFLTSLVSPFVSGNLDFHMDVTLPTGANAKSEMETAVQTEFTGMAGRGVAAAVERTLLREGYEAKKVEAGIHINRDGSVFISQIRITIDGTQKYEAAAIAGTVEREIGFSPEIFVTEPIPQ